jgi:hypothetical protein
MHTNYLSLAIRQLRDQQVRFAPHEQQIQQAESAEKLLNELDPKRTYTCKYVFHRITNNGHATDTSGTGLLVAWITPLTTPAYSGSRICLEVWQPANRQLPIRR